MILLTRTKINILKEGYYLKHKFKSMSALKMLLFTYITIIVILTLASILVYNTLTSTIDDFNTTLHTDTLSQYKSLTDSNLEAVIYTTKQVLSDNDVINFINKNTIYSDSSRSDIIQKLRSLVNSNYILDEIYLYSVKNDIFLTSDTSISSNSYGSYFQIGDMDFSTLKENMLTKYGYCSLHPSTKFRTDQTVKNCFYYSTTIPTTNIAEAQGFLIVSIDADKLFSGIQSQIISPDTHTYIYDRDNNLIACSKNAPGISILDKAIYTQKIDGTPYYIYRTTDTDKYNYVLAIPKSSVISTVVYPKIITLSAILVSLLICGILVFHFAKLNEKPIKRVLNILKPYNYSKDNSISTDDNAGNLTDGIVPIEYTQIHNAAINLIESEKEAQNIIQENTSALQSHLLHSILYENLTDEKYITDVQRQLHLENNEPYYIILISSILDLSVSSSDSFSKLFMIKSLLADRLKTNFYCLNTDINETDTVYLIGLNDALDSIPTLETSINDIVAELNETTDFRVKFSFSSVFDAISDAIFYYQEAKTNLLQGLQTKSGNIIWCSKNILTFSGYYYPSGVEERIINSFKLGKIDIVCSTIEIVKDKNCNEQILLGSAQKHLFENIICTLSKILYECTITSAQKSEIENDLNRLTSMDVDSFFSETENILTGLYNNISQQDSLGNAEAMLNYIDLHYNDPNLCRQSFSEHFKISEVYASNFFKKHTGYRFTEYVTMVRMKAACDLLANTSKTITKIAQSVGYNNDTSFRRQFISYVGVTPKEYRLNSSKDKTENE